MWFGGIIAVLLTLGGKAITALMRQGKAAVGQVRYQYPQAILAKSIRLGPITSNEVNLVCEDNFGRFLIKLDLSLHDYETVAAILNQQIAAFRGIDPPKAEKKEESKTTLIGYTFPSKHT
jgi:hypothetical protein